MNTTNEQRAIAAAELSAQAGWYRRRVKDNKREDIALSAEQRTKAEACEAIATELMRQ